MLITRKVTIPKSWAFFAQLTLILSIYGQFVINAPFIFLIKKYIDNPAAIMGLISLQVYVTFIIGPLIAWISDRIWTRFGRRKFFVGTADLFRALFLLGMPFAPNLWVLIILRWLYDFVGDAGAPGQAMIYEIVPAKQRGLSSGFMKSFLNVGNLIFFTLLLGRFHDSYFMGPFAFFGTPSGGTIMFIICALLYVGAGVFEFIGVKETYPPGRRRLMDGRKPGESLAKHFVRSVFGDIFAKDLTPLYLLLFANVMFGFSLGVFGPLLFTEQWNYDLQTFGNTVAIGVPLGIVLGLLGGWMADRYGKMKIVFIATICNLLVNIAYTIFVYYLPDQRPSFWQIVAFGNLAYVFSAIKGVASGPLLWEYVARNRMGGATAGIMVFNAIFRNTVGVFVGVWLLLWSFWFFPQAGYSVIATFDREMAEAEVMEKSVAAGLDVNDLFLKPLHQPGTFGGETSHRWWIHRESELAKDLIKERKGLRDQLGALEGKLNSFFIREAGKQEVREEMAAARERIAEIETLLGEQSIALESQLRTVIEPVRFPRGAQLLEARFEGDELYLKALTIEELTPTQAEMMENNLRGQELMMELKLDDEGIPRLEPLVEVMPASTDVFSGNAVVLRAKMDPRFEKVFLGAREVGFTSGNAFGLATAFSSIASSQFTTRTSEYRLGEVTGSFEYYQGEPVRELLVPLEVDGDRGLDTLDPASLAEVFKGFDPHLLRVDVERAAAGYLLRMVFREPESNAQDIEQNRPHSEVSERMADLLQASEGRVDLAMEVFRKFAETLASRPVIVIIPSHEMVSDFADRKYEYFFSSQLLQIVTDFFGIAILWFILILEKRGLLHRYGAEEDDNR